jgi:hypothetical protein
MNAGHLAPPELNTSYRAMVYKYLAPTELACLTATLR